MSNSLPSRPSADVLNGIKIMILSGAIAGTIATWGWIASDAFNTVKANSDDQPAEDPNKQTQFQELGIIIPTVMDVVSLQSDAVATPQPQPTTQSDLRSVSALPTQDVSAIAPEIKTVVIGVPISGGGGGGGGGKSSGSNNSQPAATSKSS